MGSLHALLANIRTDRMTVSVPNSLAYLSPDLMIDVKMVCDFGPRCQCWQTFFFLADFKIFVPGKISQASLMFVSKA